MYKNCKVVMLPTNEKALFSMSLMNILLLGGSHPENNQYKNQHLYITSDDEIKKDNWCIKSYGMPGTKEVVKYIPVYGNQCKKIIATTNKSLKLYKSETLARNSGFSLKTDDILLPQLSQQFIKKYVEEYNKGNVIEEVLVEYEKSKCKCISCERTIASTCNYPQRCNIKITSKLKTNPKDNTIIIKKVKNTMKFDHIFTEFKEERLTLEEALQELSEIGYSPNILNNGSGKWVVYKRQDLLMRNKKWHSDIRQALIHYLYEDA